MGSKHLMIDLETLSVRPDARILSIGAAVFDIDGTAVESMSVHLDAGGAVDQGTFDWWLQQSEEARLKMAKAKKFAARDALDVFEKGVSRMAGGWGAIKGVWGHGATFDITILMSLYAKLGRPTPWHFRATRDTRTFLFALETIGADAVPAWPENRLAHDAEADAVAQAKYMQMVWARLNQAEQPALGWE